MTRTFKNDDIDGLDDTLIGNRRTQRYGRRPSIIFSKDGDKAVKDVFCVPTRLPGDEPTVSELTDELDRVQRENELIEAVEQGQAFVVVDHETFLALTEDDELTYVYDDEDGDLMEAGPDWSDISDEEIERLIGEVANETDFSMDGPLRASQRLEAKIREALAKRDLDYEARERLVRKTDRLPAIDFSDLDEIILQSLPVTLAGELEGDLIVPAFVTSAEPIVFVDDAEKVTGRYDPYDFNASLANDDEPVFADDAVTATRRYRAEAMLEGLKVNDRQVDVA